METSRPQPNPSIFGIGLRTRKLNRFELDDFALSITPSSNEEGCYFPQNGKPIQPRESMYDRINKELGGVVETGPSPLTTVTSETQLQPDIAASLSFGISGIRIQAAAQDAQEETQQSTANLEANSNTEPTTPVAPQLNPRRRKSSLLEGSHLDREVLLRAFKNFSRGSPEPQLNTVSLPKIDPLPQPIIPRRKISAPPSLNPINMEPTRTVYSHFFFTGPPARLAPPTEDKDLAKSDQSINSIGESPESIQGVPNPPSQKPKRRRPKPTNFRELNMLCPTSM